MILRPGAPASRPRARRARAPAAVALALATLTASISAPGLAEDGGAVERRRSDAHMDVETDPPLDLGAAYTLDVWHNQGGVASGWRTLDNLDLTAAVDLERVAGWHGARAFAYVLYNGDHSLSELTGDAQVASNIETGVRALRLYEAWIEQDLAPGTSIKAGLYDLNSEFDALPTSDLFLGSAHGIGTDVSQSGRNGPSIFPVTSLAVRIEAKVSGRLTVRAAALDGVSGDPDHPARTAIKLGHGDGALLIAEADWTRGPLRVIAGGWGYTREQPDDAGTGVAPSTGAYVRAETTLAKHQAYTLSAFARAGVASGRANPFDTFVSGGLRLDLSESWQFGAAVAHARTSSAYRRAIPAPRAETVVELTAARALTPWLSVQPDVQYVIDPLNAPDGNDALVTGVRMTVTL